MASPHARRRATKAVKPRADSVWVGCAVPRPVYEALRQAGDETGVHYTRIMATLVCRGLRPD